MRVLLGGLIGAAAASAAWFFLEYSMNREFGWLAIAVGLITGLCVNAAAGAGAPASFGRAALAVGLTLLALVGGRVVYAKIMQSASQVATVKLADNPASLSDDQEAHEDPVGEAATDAEAAANPQLINEQQRARSGERLIPFEKPKISTVTEIDMLWMGLAALAAYFTGKGSGKSAPIAAEPTPDGTTPV